MMNNKVLKEVLPLMETAYGLGVARSAFCFARRRLTRLCQENASDSKAVKAQTENNLYPCMALYEGLQQSGVRSGDALEFLDQVWSLRAIPKARSIQRMLKIPGFYKLMPWIFRKVTLSQFGEAAGFGPRFYETAKSRCKFDMTKCLYCDLCRKYGCPELVPCFCHTDEVTNGHMHEKLIWNRTGPMGEGADVCDFDLRIQNSGKEK